VLHDEAAATGVSVQAAKDKMVQVLLNRMRQRYLAENQRTEAAKTLQGFITRKLRIRRP